MSQLLESGVQDWSFSFGISLSDEYSELVSFRIYWVDFLTVWGTLKRLLQHYSLKASGLWGSVFFMVQLSDLYMTTGKTITLTRWTFVSKVTSLLLNTLSQFSSVFQPINRSTPGLPVHHQLPESTQIHVHWVRDALQPSHPLLSPSPPALNLSQDQGLFKWVSSLHQVAKVLEFQLQHKSFQWTPRTDLL